MSYKSKKTLALIIQALILWACCQGCTTTWKFIEINKVRKIAIISLEGSIEKSEKWISTDQNYDADKVAKKTYNGICKKLKKKLQWKCLPIHRVQKKITTIMPELENKDKKVISSETITYRDFRNMNRKQKKLLAEKMDVDALIIIRFILYPGEIQNFLGTETIILEAKTDFSVIDHNGKTIWSAKGLVGQSSAAELARLPPLNRTSFQEKAMITAITVGVEEVLQEYRDQFRQR